MNEEALKLVWRMVLNAMAGKKQAEWDLYEKYLHKTRLYITIKEYTEWRKERSA